MPDLEKRVESLEKLLSLMRPHLKAPMHGMSLWSNIEERSTDPEDPPEGFGSLWLSDGTEQGDDGDLIFERTAGAVTKYANLTGMSKRATMWHDESIVTNGNALTHALNVAQRYANYSYQDAAANADSFTNGCYLRAGTYTLYVLGVTHSSRGIIDWDLDGVEIVANQDWYSAATVYNVVKSTAAVAVTFDGWHLLQGTIDGKNGSATDFRMSLTKFWFVPASD